MDKLRTKYNNAKDDHERKNTALEIYNHLLNSRNDYQTKNMQDYVEYTLEYISIDLPKKSTIAIYCGKGWEKWDPDSVNNGIAGSEEAVIYASQVLVKRGYKVIVFNTPPEKSWWSMSNINPQYTNYNDYMAYPGKFDILIIWRNQNFPDQMLNKANRIYHWLHDVGSINNPYCVTKQSTGVFFLSTFHRNSYPQITCDNCIAGNGIIPEQFAKCGIIKRDKYKCIYASNYTRGLSILLSVWPFVKQQIPQATLDIYYGRETYNALDKNQFQILINTLTSLKPLGVNEMGKVGHQQLADVMCSASVWSYPCLGNSETFCITAVKAQAAGLIPVCATPGALKEVLLTEESSIMDEIITADHVVQYRTMLINTLTSMNDDSDENVIKIQVRRNKLREHGLKYTWDRVVDKWLELDTSCVKKCEGECDCC